MEKEKTIDWTIYMLWKDYSSKSRLVECSITALKAEL